MRRRQFLKCAATGLFLPAMGGIGQTVSPSLRMSTEVLDYAARVATNGGAALSANTLAALDRFTKALYQAGIRSAMRAVLTVVPDNLTAAITPFIKNTGNDPWTNTGGFVGADLTVNGLIGNGAKYLKTGIICNTLWPAGTTTIEGGYTIYNMTAANAATAELGALSGGGNNYMVYADAAGAGNCNCYYGANLINPNNSLFTGMVSFNKLPGPTTDLYRASSTVAFSTLLHSTPVGVGTGCTQELYAWANNNNGAVASQSSRRLSFIAVHNGLNYGEAFSFYNAIQNLRIALGGGFV